jgi:hypothetical protein
MICGSIEPVSTTEGDQPRASGSKVQMNRLTVVVVAAITTALSSSRAANPAIARPARGLSGGPEPSAAPFVDSATTDPSFDRAGA